MSTRHQSGFQVVSGFKALYKWLVAGVTVCGTLLAIGGYVKPAHRWLVALYEDHSKIAFVVALALCLALSATSIAISNRLPKARQATVNSMSVVSSGPPEMFTRRLEDATQVEIMFTTGQRFLQTHKRPLSVMIEHNGHLRLLVARPRSQFLRDVQEMESSPTRRRADLSAEVRGAIATLAEIRETTNRGRIDYATYNTHLRVSMIIIDRKYAWVGLTLPPFRTTETPGILAGMNGGTPDQLLDMAVRHFDQVWSVLPDSDKFEVTSSLRTSD